METFLRHVPKRVVGYTAAGEWSIYAGDMAV